MAKKKKDNFNQAMFEMFGVGKEPDMETSVVEEDSSIAKAAEAAVEEWKTTETEPAAVSIPTRVSTYLAPGTSFEGTLTSKGDVEIAGTFKGDLVVEGDVIMHTNIVGNITAGNLKLIDCSLTGDVTATGRVKLDETSAVFGNIKANDINCSGTVNGDLEMAGNVTLNEKAKVNGKISTSTMSVARGAQIHGTVDMHG